MSIESILTLIRAADLLFRAGEEVATAVAAHINEQHAKVRSSRLTAQAAGRAAKASSDAAKHISRGTYPQCEACYWFGETSLGAGVCTKEGVVDTSKPSCPKFEERKAYVPKADSVDRCKSCGWYNAFVSKCHVPGGPSYGAHGCSKYVYDQIRRRGQEQPEP